MPKPLDRELSEALRNRAELAARLAAEDAKIQALLKAQRELIETLVDNHRVLDLRTEGDLSSIKHMETTAPDKTKKIGRPITSTHPFIARALKLHGSIKAAAEALEVPAATVRSWYASGDDARAIPKDMVDKLSRAPWSIPKSAWKNVK